MPSPESLMVAAQSPPFNWLHATLAARPATARLRSEGASPDGLAVAQLALGRLSADVADVAFSPGCLPRIRGVLLELRNTIDSHLLAVEALVDAGRTEAAAALLIRFEAVCFETLNADAAGDCAGVSA